MRSSPLGSIRCDYLDQGDMQKDMQTCEQNDKQTCVDSHQSSAGRAATAACHHLLPDLSSSSGIYRKGK